MKYVFLLSLNALCYLSVLSQVNITNSSFDGGVCDFCVANGWTFCNYLNAVVDPNHPAYQGIIPKVAVNGLTYAVMENQPFSSTDQGSLATKLPCVLKQGYTYRLELYAASVRGNDSSIFKSNKNGRIEIYLGNDSCSKMQLLYRSSILDTVWNKIALKIQPQLPLYYFTFWPINFPNDSLVDIALDALSPIYLINANAVHVASKDTVVYTQPNEQKCITVKATSTITTYDTVRWYKLVDTVKVPVALGLQASVCVDSNTTFLIGLRDSVIGCAGVEWSWDTLRVWVRDTVLGVREVDAVHAFSLQPNPVVDVLTITPSFEGPYDWTITDALGRLSAKGRGRNTTEVPLDGLSRGAYLLQVEGVVRRFLKE
ncbi:MAG: T9SS type A sorting domain-containing protein [Chitinophagales bacterium]